MFNPYVAEPCDALRPVMPGPKPGGILGTLTDRLSRLDRDDLLILLLVYLVAGDGDEDGIWPLLAVLLYLML